MLRQSVFSIAAAVFFGGAVQTQIAQAGDDIWDLMDPSWWADQFDDDDDDYWRYGPDPYFYGGPYGWHHSPYPMYPMQQPAKKKQPAPLPIPE